ncbi:hypothetical protein B4U80_11248 [Leptotrombidium deliense]|uniref:Small integral membrane protein 4 n=1 Tax=Leptotrombidium deliense TaxID=299467 RepID=A0A443S1S3_9ACAR|nr:hypothetical protein B4U80_11248 [Leptotrombidium deliense]
MQLQKKRKKSILQRVITNWPLRKQLGFYSFIPLFVAAGAALEFVMIKWTVGETNFYTVYKRNLIERSYKSDE